MKDTTIFEKIISGEFPSYKVWEDAEFFAFLDINPLTKGHTLVVPKKPRPDLFDLDDETYSKLMSKAKVVGGKLRKAMGTSRVGMIVAGFGVPDHVHIHLVPINSEKELFGSSIQLNSNELKEIQAQIITHFE